MSRYLRALTVAAVGFILAGTAVAQPRLKVFVTAAHPEARKKPDDATTKDLQSKMQAARRARQDLEKQLKAELGKKEESWPEDKQNALYDAREAEALTNAEYAYRRIDPEALSDSALDLKNALTGKGMQSEKTSVQIVESADDADLVAEVVARRSEKDPNMPALGFRDNSFFISFILKPGGKTQPSRLAAITQYRFKKFGHNAWTLQRPRQDSPEWRFDAHGDARWSNAADTAAMVINDFIEKNQAKLATQ